VLLHEDIVLRDAEEFVVAAYDDVGKLARCVDHSILVGSLLAEQGCSRAVVAAGLLHDVVEDTSATDADVRERFGDEIAELVAALTEDATIDDYRERKAALREAVREGGLRTQLIFAADKVAQLRRADRREESFDHRTMDHYRRSLEMLTTTGHRITLVDEFRWRLDQRRRHLRTLPLTRPALSW
jgi:(p)ppGpp synthase/HD superfamily hydrolase